MYVSLFQFIETKQFQGVVHKPYTLQAISRHNLWAYLAKSVTLHSPVSLLIGYQRGSCHFYHMSRNKFAAIS